MTSSCQTPKTTATADKTTRCSLKRRLISLLSLEVKKSQVLSKTYQVRHMLWGARSRRKKCKLLLTRCNELRTATPQNNRSLSSPTFTLRSNLTVLRARKSLTLSMSHKKTQSQRLRLSPTSSNRASQFMKSLLRKLPRKRFQKKA